MNIKDKHLTLRNGSLAVFGITLLFLGIFSMVQTSVQQSSSGNATSAGDSDRRLADFAKKLDTAIKESNVNLTVPRNGSLSEFITKLNSSEGFQTLSQKFSQLAQESGINANVTGERLKNLQGGERTNLTGLAEKLQEVMGRVQPLRE
jgi:hypothetical protein